MHTIYRKNHVSWGGGGGGDKVLLRFILRIPWCKRPTERGFVREDVIEMKIAPERNPRCSLFIGSHCESTIAVSKIFWILSKTNLYAYLY